MFEGKSLTLEEVARLIDAEGLTEGCKTIRVNKVCPPEGAGEGCAVVISDERHLKSFGGKPTLLILKKNLTPPPKAAACFLFVKNPRLALAKLLNALYPPSHPTGVSERATIGEGVRIGKDVYVGDFAYIGNRVVLEDGVKIYPGCYIGDNAVVGEGTVIYPNVFVAPNTLIGRGVIIHPGAVVGREGFGFVFDGEKHLRLRHIGIAVIGDFAEIGANTCVDRALLDKTIVGEGAKIDNLVQIAHNDKIGRGAILVSQVGLSGSVEVGDFAVLAGQVGVADHVRIGAGATVVAKSGVTKDLEGGKVYGALLPAMEWSKWKRIYAVLMKLPELIKRLKNNK